MSKNIFKNSCLFCNRNHYGRHIVWMRNVSNKEIFCTKCHEVYRKWIKETTITAILKNYDCCGKTYITPIPLSEFYE